MKAHLENKYDGNDKENNVNSLGTRIKTLFFGLIHSMLNCYDYSALQYSILSVIIFLQICYFPFSQDVFYYE